METSRINQNAVLTATDLAKYLKIGRDKAYALIKSPSFPALQIGSRYIVTEQALIEWLDDNKHRHVIV